MDAPCGRDTSEEVRGGGKCPKCLGEDVGREADGGIEVKGWVQESGNGRRFAGVGVRRKNGWWKEEGEKKGKGREGFRFD